MENFTNEYRCGKHSERGQILQKGVNQAKGTLWRKSGKL